MLFVLQPKLLLNFATATFAQPIFQPILLFTVPGQLVVEGENSQQQKLLKFPQEILA